MYKAPLQAKPHKLLKYALIIFGTLSKRISRIGAVIKAQSATESSSTVLLHSITNSKLTMVPILKSAHKYMGVNVITLQVAPSHTSNFLFGCFSRAKSLKTMSTHYTIPTAKNDSSQVGVSWNYPGDFKMCYWNALKMHSGARLRASSRGEL